jgi:hypothetical protein
VASGNGNQRIWEGIVVHEMVTSLSGEEVLERAKGFFTERVPRHGVYLEEEGPSFATFRGQGGEEIALATRVTPAGTTVRASTLLFDQAIGRFFSTLPPAREADVA